MAASPIDPSDRLLIFGINHRSAAPPLRDEFLSDALDAGPMLAELQMTGFQELAVLATCDRLEVVTLQDDAAAAKAALLPHFSRWAEVEDGELTGQVFEARGEAALRHLFAIAASLESQVVGEPQVLGQVKESQRLAQALGCLGPGLDALFQGAVVAAKRVRSETPLAERPVSILTSALSLARNIHGDLTRCRGLLLGLGEIAEFLAGEFREAGLSELTLVHASDARGEAVAHRLQCHYRPWSELEAALDQADIVISSLGLGRHTVSKGQGEAALKARRRRPIFFIDSALPADIDPGVEDLDGAFVYNLDDLESVAQEGRARREDLAEAAWAIVDEEVAGFRRNWAERAAAPAVTELRRYFAQVREDVLAEGRQDAETATRLLVGRLLHGPSEVLRQTAAKDASEAAVLTDSLKTLFALPAKGEEPSAESPQDKKESER